jgi:ribonucleoside-diphosphate reductase subunit M2
MSDNERQVLSIFPIRNQPIYDFYLKSEASYWVVKEIDFSKDLDQWNLLKEEEKYFLSHILSFFSQSDQIVNTNLEERFSKDVKNLPDDMNPYVQMFYDHQKMMENIHSITYETLLNIYITDKNHLTFLKNGIQNIPCIKRKAEWAFKWIDDVNSSFPTRLIAFAALEGIFFSGSFAAIFWMKDRNILDGLTKSNEFISRDEGLHRDFACELYNQLKNRDDYDFDCKSSTIIKIITEAVVIEQEFIIDSFQCKLIGMNSKYMKDYIEFIADNLLQNIGEEKYYNTKNPLDFMNNISLQHKSNFFESRETNYSKANSYNDNGSVIILDDDF